MSTDNRPDLTAALLAANAANVDASGAMTLLPVDSAEIHWIGPGETKDLWRAYDVRRGNAEASGLDVARLRRFVDVLKRHERGPGLLILDVKCPDRRVLAAVEAATMQSLAEVFWARASAGEMTLISSFA